MRRLTAFALLSTLALAAGCTGHIGGDDGGEDPPPGTPSGNDPGRVTLHRLNRAEYNNTVRDLLGTSLTPADDFPSDDHSYGFDNNADALVMSPLMLELYERAAETLAHDVLDTGIPSSITRYEAEDVGGTVGAASGGAWNLYSNGDVVVTQVLPAAGKYRVRARVWADAAGPDAAQASFSINGLTYGPFDVTASAASPAVLEQEIDLGAGTATVMVSFLNDYYDSATGQDRNLYVDYLEVEGPIGGMLTNPLRDRFVTCDLDTGDPCVREIIEGFGRRAYRRTLSAAEVDGLVSVYQLALDNGDDANKGIELVLRAILTSPNFLFRVEIDDEPTSLEAHPLSGFELASRLSYFLWSSTPDDTLLDLAESGELVDPTVLEAQVDRMLADDKSRALVDNLGGEWLFFRALAGKTPTAAAYPSFDETLRASMQAEAEAFFSDLLHDPDLTLTDLVRADFTYVDARLAEHYGLPAPTSGALERVAVGGAPRGGLLRQGAWLTVTSNPDRTSPVKRGRWILENLLCDEPPPPPPGVEGFKPQDLEVKTQKELLAAHRADPACSGCHASMDPLGLALENYDGIGAFRTEDKGEPIDPSGEVGDVSWQTPDELLDLLSVDPRLPACAVEKMFVYALGRGVDASDAPYLENLSAEFQVNGLALRELLRLIATSEPFRFRRGEPAEQGAQP
ncbi:MAG: DUF1592 domain-containing protein [Polyangiaceae bacterium]